VLYTHVLAEIHTCWLNTPLYRMNILSLKNIYIHTNKQTHTHAHTSSSSDVAVHLRCWQKQP
jgi:hypothetical protein